MLTKEERQKYLDQWGTTCYICHDTCIERKDMHIIEDTVTVRNNDVVGSTLVYSMVCSECKEMHDAEKEGDAKGY